ncbi:hypothetical protein PsYK624_138750 [Phanerochaete sordida]|uniref:Uncharacterized protein n=1 Tax=Phanerochaete sordida TaxID=48140 RepID=A0A9P3GQL0_9APHY|nr:hypothetical protein PsYK624_138750 [Phanerochaete sordida]
MSAPWVTQPQTDYYSAAPCFPNSSTSAPQGAGSGTYGYDAYDAYGAYGAYRQPPHAAAPNTLGVPPMWDDTSSAGEHSSAGYSASAYGASYGWGHEDKTRGQGMNVSATHSGYTRPYGPPGGGHHGGHHGGRPGGHHGGRPTGHHGANQGQHGGGCGCIVM